VLLPGADHSTDGVMARLDRLERRMTITGGDPSPAPTVPTEPASVRPAPHVVEPTVIQPVRPPAPAPTSTEPAAPVAEPVVEAPAAQAPAAPSAVPETTQPPEPAPTTTTSAGSTLSLVDVRRLWPDIVEATKQRRRLTWIYLTQQAQVVAVDDQTLTLGFANAGARDSFDGGGSAEIVRQAAIDVVGHDWRVETIVDPGANPETAPPPTASAPAAPSAPATPGPVTSEAPDWAQPETDAGAPPAAPAPPAERPSESARQAIAATRGAAGAAGAADAGDAGDPGRAVDPDDGAHPDDTDAESAGLDSTQLLQEALGAQVIEEIPHQ
jgi:DNA polymerase III subunit gamma/tau